MVQSSEFISSNSIFAAHTQPQLQYVCKEGIEALKAAHTLQSQPETAELIIIVAGHGRYMIDDHIYDIKKGNILLINAGILHGLCPEEAPQLETYHIGIKALHLNGSPPGQLINKDTVPVLTAEEYFTLIQNFLLLLDTLTDVPEKSSLQEIQDNILAALLTVITRIINHSSRPNAHLPEYNLGLHIKEYIDEHYLEDLKLSDIAAALHINPYYMSHTFKKVVGYSPIQYMIRRRIGESQNLLINTGYTITDIALRCGYNNSNYFQAVFNSIVGMPPGRYRKTWRQ
ncbi:MAG: AraC family transcriptional regulator [Anaerovibrio sp.]|uniref:helix-turn-helix transcriptional regulator n=1 Tax=Anaerovibrio sp. TaxID=1872532 RepID=UPI0025FBEA8F|nr:AraC family transcriptional regulator [Anaerovibrio sp.]MCR5175372.1 AraC family transcriptional regulator [Anaerovibrio sp.]